MSNPSSYVPSGALGKIVIGFFVFNTLLELLCAVFVSGSAGMDAEPLSFAAAVYTLLVVILLPTLLMTAFVFCLWWYRVVKNLSALGAHDLEFTPKGAVWAFFIPLLNLFRPQEAGQEIWKASDPGLIDNTPLSRKDMPRSPLIGFWWTFFLLGNAFDGASARFDAAAAVVGMSLIGHLLTSAAAICAIVMVKRIAERQEARLRVLGGSPAAAGAAAIPSLPQMETAG